MASVVVELLRGDMATEEAVESLKGVPVLDRPGGSVIVGRVVEAWLVCDEDDGVDRAMGRLELDESTPEGAVALHQPPVSIKGTGQPWSRGSCGFDG